MGTWISLNNNNQKNFHIDWIFFFNNFYRIFSFFMLSFCTKQDFFFDFQFLESCAIFILLTREKERVFEKKNTRLDSDLFDIFHTQESKY